MTIKVTPKPVECWIIKVVWDNGDVSLYPSSKIGKEVRGWGVLGEPWISFTHPITGVETCLRKDKLRETSWVRGTVTQRPKGNPLNDEDHYDNPDN